MASNKDRIYIPNKIKVGFQKREDTFAGKLAYVIYYDNFGKLRKEGSWTRWRDDKIPALEIENTPTSGLTLNKGIKRYSWSHYSSGRSMIRIYDPRGFEYEIEPSNLVGLLMHTDCNRREIQGDLVYAWHRGDLLLLPTSSEEYQNAKKYTELQATKVSAKALVPGYTYVTKAQDNIIYLGRHKYYEIKGSEYTGNHGRAGKNQHIFIDAEGERVPFPISSVAGRVAAVLSEEPHQRTGEWTEAYLKSSAPHAVKQLKIRKHDFARNDKWHTAYRLEDGVPTQHSIKHYPTSFETVVSRQYLNIQRRMNSPGWYRSDSNYTFKPCGASVYRSAGYYYRSDRPHHPIQDISQFGKLVAVLDDGREIIWPPKN